MNHSKELKIAGEKEDHLNALREMGFSHIATKIDAMWETPTLNQYFNQIIIDHRGDRAGFPKEAFSHIMRLFVLHNVDNNTFHLDPWILTHLK